MRRLSDMRADVVHRPEPFAGKRVIVLGLSSTAADVLPDVIPHAAHPVYSSHRRGAFPFTRFRNGRPTDGLITWRRRELTQFVQNYFPTLTRIGADLVVNILAKQAYPNLRPEWRFTPVASVALKLPGSLTFDSILPCLEDGRLESVHGIKRFTGPKQVELLDGRVLDDIDAVICCTGYQADFSVVDEDVLATSKPSAYGYAKGGGGSIRRMWMNMFPPRYADSFAMLCYSAYGKSNGFSFADVTSLAISHVFSGEQPIPSREEMEEWVDEHQKWVASRWKLDHSIDVSMVKQWEFQGWLHEAAGTGMDNLSLFGWKGWKFWWADRKMYNLMANGIETAHMYRFFETGKRKAWPGAREAIVRINNEWNRTLPVSKEQQKEYLIVVEKIKK